MKPSPWLRVAAMAGVVMVAAGCLQIETLITLNEDGSARINERVFFSDRLLAMAGEQRGDLVALLGRERLLARMKRMGERCVLVRHELREGGDGWVESEAEITVPDLNELHVVSPWFAYGDYADNNRVRIELAPQYKRRPYQEGPAGAMAVRFVHPRRPRNDTAPPALSPRDQQIYRDLVPVLQHLLEGFMLRVTFASYAPISTALGATSAGGVSVDLLKVSAEDLDTASGLFFANEEIMLELARLDFGGPNVAANVHRASTLPTYLPLGGRSMWRLGGRNIWFAPSKALFDRHFAGKKLDPSAWQASPPEKHVPATFERIGWKGWQTDSTAPDTGAVKGR